DRAQPRGDLLTDPPAIGRTALAVEVALEAMADRLMQQHAGPAWPQHYRQRARRRRHRLEIDQRLTQRLAGIAHSAVFAEKILIAGASAATLAAPLTTTVLLDDHADVEAHQRSDIR